MAMSSLARRSLLLTAISLAGIGRVGGATLSWYSDVDVHNDLEVVRRRIVVPRLPSAFAGLTIGQLGDLHVGRWVTAAHVRSAVDRLLAHEPSLIVVTGDLISRLTHGEAAIITHELARLRAPLGVFAVLGNHDYLPNPVTISAAIQEAGLTLLKNTHARLDLADQVLYVAGIDDAIYGIPNLALALRGVPENAHAILLAHEPDYADVAARDSRVIFQFSGHSHGGQGRLPGLGPIYLPDLGRRYPLGLYQVGRMKLYTTRGVGVVGVPFRFNCRPEITLLELTPT